MEDYSALILTNAAGMVKTRADAEKLLTAPVTRITIGSVRFEPCAGNSGETYWPNSREQSALNAIGLQSPGAVSLLDWLPSFHRECTAQGKEVAVSIAGTTPEEYRKLTVYVHPYCDILEVNAGCGNMWGLEGQKPIPSYTPELLHDILAEVARGLGGHREKVSVKISPIGDSLIKPIADVLRSFPILVEVIGCNTLPNQEDTRTDGTSALAFLEPEGTELKHTGGLSGRPLKRLSQQVLRQMIPLLPDLRFIGCGGIFTADDLQEYIDLGAVGGAVGIAFFEQGPKVFQEILLGLGP